MTHGDEIAIRGRSLALARGDLTQFAADVIVNAANNALAGGGGVDGAIHRVGGRAIMRDLEARYGTDRHCPTGGAVPTVAGALPARWVIHAVGPVWRGGGSGEAELLRLAYRTSLGIADELGAASIALPAISCGIYGYPLEEGATIALETVAAHLAGETGLARATFVLYSGDTYAAFARALTRVPGAPGTAKAAG
jgi:O-acetyl-ADP-ribose deacetylase